MAGTYVMVNVNVVTSVGVGEWWRCCCCCCCCCCCVCFVAGTFLIRFSNSSPGSFAASYVDYNEVNGWVAGFRVGQLGRWVVDWAVGQLGSCMGSRVAGRLEIKSKGSGGSFVCRIVCCSWHSSRLTTSRAMCVGNVYLCLYLCVFACLYLCVFACLCVCACVCWRVCVRVCIDQSILDCSAREWNVYDKFYGG